MPIKNPSDKEFGPLSLDILVLIIRIVYYEYKVSKYEVTLKLRHK